MSRLGYNRWSTFIEMTKSNKREIKNLEKGLKDLEFSFNIENRILILENTMKNFINNKKADINIDPRIIFWIILILLLLFLKVSGIFG